MKSFFKILLFLIMVSHGNLNAQDIPPPNPTMVISILSGYSVSFTFDEMTEYKNGIINQGQTTFIRIGAVIDWKLQFKADQTIFYGENNPSNQMELNNVGVVVVSSGTNQDDGSNIINYAKVTPIALESNDVILMTKGTMSNRGYENRNSFTMNWEMGTKRGNMNSESMLQQMLEADTYIVNIILTLSPYNQ